MALEALLVSCWRALVRSWEIENWRLEIETRYVELLPFFNLQFSMLGDLKSEI